MNQEHQVDDLLKDLDTALSIEPSPAVAVKVRASLAGEPARGWWTRVFVGQVFVGHAFRFAGGAALVLVAVASYMMWPRAKPQMPIVQQAIVQPPGTTPIAPVVQVPNVAIARTPRSTVTRPRPQPPMAPADREPEVLISPAIRLALAQFDALTRGRVATAEPEPGIPETIEPGAIVIDVVKIDPPAQTSGGGIRK